jgi:cellulose synthase/poly-beta-1,6-N-acetylglucosamine synthase-like glycosyltransferase
MLKEREFLVNEKNKVWYVVDITDNVAEIIKVKWDSEIQGFKFKDKLKQVNVNDDNLFKFRSFDPDEARTVAIVLKEIQYDKCQSCGVCCEDIK